MASRESILIPLYEAWEWETVPTSTGIYAWFIRHPIQSEDPNRISQRITDSISMSFAEDRHVINSETKFHLKWTGELNQVSTRDVRQFTLDFLSELRQDGAKALSSTVNFLNLIMDHLPPLVYIGKADELRERLGTHYKALNKRYSNESMEEFDFESKTFAERAHSNDIKVDFLRFTYFEFPTTGSLLDKKSNQFVESIVNQIHRPQLGRK